MSRSLLLLVSVLITIAGSAHAESYKFSTGSPDGKIGVATRPPAGGRLEIEAADDFITPSQTNITSASFLGLLPAAIPPSGVSEVTVKIYRVFPLDSITPPSGQVPTRANSPSDVVFDSRNSFANTLTFTAVLVNPSIAVANSVVNGIHPVPNQFTGGEGPASGAEVLVTTTFNPPMSLPSGHFFFLPQVQLASGDFLWLSAPNPIVTPGTPFTGDLQSWIRNANLAPDWLRIGTDIVGGAMFNQAFDLTGTDDIIFRNGFD